MHHELEKFGVGAQADNVDCIGGLILPDEEKIGADMTFHAPGIVAGKHMWAFFRRDCFALGQIVKNAFQFSEQTGTVAVAFEIFFELMGVAELLHDSMEAIMLSSEERSISPAYSPRFTSSMAVRVMALGSRYTTSINTDST